MLVPMGSRTLRARRWPEEVCAADNTATSHAVARLTFLDLEKLIAAMALLCRGQQSEPEKAN